MEMIIACSSIVSLNNLLLIGNAVCVKISLDVNLNCQDAVLQEHRNAKNGTWIFGAKIVGLNIEVPFERDNTCTKEHNEVIEKVLFASSSIKVFFYILDFFL